MRRLPRGGELPMAAHVFPCEALVRRVLRGGWRMVGGGVGAPFPCEALVCVVLRWFGIPGAVHAFPCEAPVRKPLQREGGLKCRFQL